MKTKEEILQAVIEKAVKNGFNEGGVSDVDLLISWYIGYEPSPIEKLIFNVDFAKALWREDRKVVAYWYETSGDKDIETHAYAYNGGIDTETDLLIPLWQYHLQQLAISENRIEYLKQFIDEN